MYQKKLNRQSNNKNNDPYKYSNTSNTKLEKDSEINQEENITETKVVKRSATEIFKCNKTRSSNKTRTKKEQMDEKEQTVQKNSTKQNNRKGNKEWTTKQVKKSSLNKKNKQRDANIDRENDQDYQIDGLENNEKNKTNERKRKDKKTENKSKSSNLIEKLDEIISDVDEEINQKKLKSKSIKTLEKSSVNNANQGEQSEKELNDEIEKLHNENTNLNADKIEADKTEVLLNNMLVNIKENQQKINNNTEGIIDKSEFLNINSKDESKSQERHIQNDYGKSETVENKNVHISSNEIKKTILENDILDKCNANVTSVNKENIDELSPFDDIIDENDPKNKDSSLDIRNNCTEKKQEETLTTETHLENHIKQSSTIESVISKSTDENKSEEESSLVLPNNYRLHNSTNQTNYCMVEILYRRFANGLNPWLNEVSRNLNTEVNMVTRNMKGLIYEINKGKKDIYNYRELNDSDDHLNIYKDRLFLLRRFHESVRFNWLKKNNKLTNEDIEKSKGWFNSLMRSLSVRSNWHKKQRVYLKMLVAKFLKGELINFEKLFKKFNLLIN